jgi:hypothetical protein
MRRESNGPLECGDRLLVSMVMYPGFDLLLQIASLEPDCCAIVILGQQWFGAFEFLMGSLEVPSSHQDLCSRDATVSQRSRVSRAARLGDAPIGCLQCRRVLLCRRLDPSQCLIVFRESEAIPGFPAQLTRCQQLSDSVVASTLGHCDLGQDTERVWTCLGGEQLGCERAGWFASPTALQRVCKVSTRDRKLRSCIFALADNDRLATGRGPARGLAVDASPARDKSAHHDDRNDPHQRSDCTARPPRRAGGHADPSLWALSHSTWAPRGPEIRQA